MTKESSSISAITSIWEMQMNKQRILAAVILSASILFASFGFSLGGDNCSQCTKIIFDHQFHLTEAGAACADCHKNVDKSENSYDNNYPKMEACGECHNITDKQACAACHTDPNNIVPREGYCPNYEIFNHQEHLEEKLECLTCHTGISASTEIGCQEAHLPKMTDCLKCHEKMGQTWDCASCHIGNHPEAGDKSVLEWTKTHGLEAAFDPEKFRQYFELGYCEDCHQGLNLNGQMHQPGWLFVHGDEAMAGGECLVCHQDLQQCSECHRTMLPVPHPLGDPAFANPVSGGSHTEEAESFFEACIVCHHQGTISPTCARCHN